MKIAFFSIGTTETRALAEVARLRGHTIKLCLFQTEEERAWLKHADILVVRFFSKTYDLACETVDRFQEQNPKGVVTTTTKGIRDSIDKYLTYDVLRSAGIATPATYLIKDMQDVQSLIPKLPLILKPRRENRGIGIVVVHTPEMFQKHAKELLDEYQTAIAQDYIAESAGKDVRAFVIGDKVVASMERSAPEGSLTANLARGGTAVAITLDEQAVKMALTVNKAFESQISGVDLLRTRNGWTVIENNTSPGFRVGKIANIDLMGMVIDHLVACRENNV